MSFTSIPNQPIIFHDQAELDINCNCNDDSFKQLIDFDDQIFFQLNSEFCDAQLRPYETESEGWGVPNENNQLCSILTTDTGFRYINFRTLYPYSTYQITLNVLSLTSGVLNVSCVGSNAYVIYTAGSYTLNFENPLIVLNSITFKIESVDGFIGCINTTVTAHGIPTSNELKVGLVDAETLELIEFINPTFIDTNNNVTVAINVPDLEIGEGCYRLAIADFCLNTCSQFYVANNTFAIGNEGLTNWTTTQGFGAFFYFNQNLACIETPFEDGEGELISSNELCEGKYYYISIIVDNVTNTNIYAQIGNSTVQFPFNAIGYLTVGILAGAPSGFNGTKLVIFFQNNSGPGIACISQVDVQIDDADVQWNYFSDILSIGDYDDECKYLKVEGCNAQDQFGLSFSGSSFLPSIRLTGMRTKAQYESNAKLFRYSSGKWSTNYADITKQWTYHFGRLPEYVLDFLSTIFYYDNCYVNGYLVSPADDKFPQIKYDDADPKLGMFEIDLLSKNNKVVKTVCYSSDANCLPSILDDGDGPFILTQDSERLVSQNGINLYQEN